MDRYNKLLQIVAKIGMLKQIAIRLVTSNVDSSKVSHILSELYYLKDGTQRVGGASPDAQFSLGLT